jgi:hypothetical protein
MKTLLLATLVAAAPTAILADSNHGHGGSDFTEMGQSGAGGTAQHPMMAQMMQMMMQMHGGMMSGGAGPDMGMMGGSMAPMMQMHDADGDGTATPEELQEGLLSQLADYDENGDGTLVLSEFEALFLAMVRERMVDRFQHLDADGDGAITTEEMTAPARMMNRPSMGMMGGMPESGEMPGMGGSSMPNDN